MKEGNQPMTKLAATLLLAGISAISFAPAALAAPRVAVSIKPLHSLVASIMKGVGEADVIVKGAGSPHTYQMTPTDARTLQDAEVVFWIGPDFEKFLERPIQSLGSGAKVVELDEAKGVTELPAREGGTFDAHDHHEQSDSHDHTHEDHGSDTDGEDDHHHRAFDNHIWLSTANARALAAEIERTLSEMDPANAVRYRTNLAKLDADLITLSTEIKATLAPVRSRPFIVFHDAYQYFEREFDLRVAGSITVSPEALPGAARISEIRNRIETLGATCVFAEPQFEPRLVETVLEGTGAKGGTLDPEAATLSPGPKLYFDLMHGLAGSIAECLNSKS
jgi:zinc transport system substrate-binding protein